MDFNLFSGTLSADAIDLDFSSSLLEIYEYNNKTYKFDLKSIDLKDYCKKNSNSTIYLNTTVTKTNFTLFNYSNSTKMINNTNGTLINNKNNISINHTDVNVSGLYLNKNISLYTILNEPTTIEIGNRKSSLKLESQMKNITSINNENYNSNIKPRIIARSENLFVDKIVFMESATKPKVNSNIIINY